MVQRNYPIQDLHFWEMDVRDLFKLWFHDAVFNACPACHHSWFADVVLPVHDWYTLTQDALGDLRENSAFRQFNSLPPAP